MEGRTWLAMLGRWLQPVTPDALAPSIDRAFVPPGTRLLARKHGTASANREARILVAMIPWRDEPHPGERVHQGRYLVADPECCVLVGDEGVHFIPWEAIAWIRT
jgi:hypothetical protein